MNARYKYLISVHAKRQTFQYVNHSVSVSKIRLELNNEMTDHTTIVYLKSRKFM